MQAYCSSQLCRLAWLLVVVSCSLSYGSSDEGRHVAGATAHGQHGDTAARNLPAAMGAAATSDPFELPWGLPLSALDRSNSFHHPNAHSMRTARRALLQRHRHRQRVQQQQKPRVKFDVRVEQMTARQLQASLFEGHSWPGFIVPDRERRFGIAYQGDLSRLRAALDRQHKTGNLTVVVVGGSISAGAGAVDTHSWPEWVEDWIGERYNGSHDLGYRDVAKSTHVVNGAVPGTYSSYMAVCYSIHVPQDADVVIVEYSLNDEQTLSNKLFDNAVRRPFERLLRKLLQYPNNPAVVLLNAYAWFQLQDDIPDGTYYTGSDREFFELATYYHLPMLSIKACCWRLMHAGHKGFNVTRQRGHPVTGGKEPDEVDKVYKQDAFYWDVIHPDGWTGHAAMSDLVVQLFMDAERSLRRRPFSAAEARRITDRDSLPPPMIGNNWESADDKCLVGPSLSAALYKAAGFEWKNDVPPPKKPKWGYIGTDVGASIAFKINTVAPSSQPGQKVAVEVAYLRSYEGLGIATITCSNCMCKPTQINGIHEPKTSLLTLQEVMVTQHKECIVTISIDKDTKDPGGGHKVKVSGLMVSDEGDQDEHHERGIGQFRAFEYIQTGIENNGTFELRKTWEP